MDVSKYLALYLSEARDHLQNMERMIESLEAGEGGDVALNELFRSAHSLKGMSAAMGQTVISERAHALEDLLLPYRDQKRAPEAGVLERARAVAEELATMVEEVAAAGGAPIDTGEPETSVVEPGEAVAADGAAAPPEGRPAGPERTVEVTVEMELARGSSPARTYEIAKAASDAGLLLGTYPFFYERPTGGQGLRLVLHLRTAWNAARLQQELSGMGQDLRVRIVPIPDPTPPRTQSGWEATAEPVKLDVTVLERLASRSESLTSAVRQLTREQGRRPNLLAEVESIAEGISAEVAQARLRPLADISAALPGVARTVARSRGRRLEVKVDVGDIELDRTIVERLRDPLVHLVRNAVDHGLEDVADREAAGKAAEGRLSVVALRRGPRIEIVVEDDGRGIDADAVAAKAIAAGAVDPAEADQLSEQEKLQLICLPGLSTTKQADGISGRGVGMDVVAEAVRSVGGGLRIETALGRGSRFTLWLPAAVLSDSLVLVRIGEDEMYGLPQHAVRAVLGDEDDRLDDDPAEILEIDGERLESISLAEELGRPNGTEERNLIVVETGRGRRAYRVARVVDRVDGVIRPLHAPLSSIPGLLGFAKSGGRTLFVLDPERLAPEGG